MRLQANSPTRTMWMPACCISVKSASHRDSGHCSGYHAVPSSNAGVCGAACASNELLARAVAHSTTNIKVAGRRECIFIGVILSEEVAAATDESKDPFLPEASA